MLSRIRKRMTWANVAMTLALVFAMTGGAYAAKKFIITNTKQISPKVLKQLEGKAGPVGPQGPAGSAGAAGKEGLAGKEGTPGKEGKEGKQGIQGIQGEPGKEGKEGSPWTAGGTLPSGKTETGSWSVLGNNPLIPASISFSIPLELSLGGSNVFVLKPGQTNSHCEGTASEPSAAAGYLCVYAGFIPGEEEEEPELVPAGAVYGGPIHKPTEKIAPTAGSSGAAKTGALLVFENKKIGTQVDAYGTWAVTAE